MVEVGQLAPDFTLVDQHGEQVSLSQFRGHQNVVLLFFPFAFSGTCTGELTRKPARFARGSGRA